MNSESLFETLRYMGLRQESAQVLVLLPLIEVAWADGLIQAGERDLILSIARYKFDFSDDALDMLDAWLSHRPDEEYLTRGRAVLKVLARGSSVGLDESSLSDVLRFCHDVANAAGGFLGIGKVHHRERSALAEIAKALQLRQGVAMVGERSVHESPEELDYAALIVDDLRKGELAEPMRFDDGTIATLAATSGRKMSFQCGENGLTIGRSRANAVALQNDGKVSRKHCEIIVRKGVFYIQDNQSANGTWVNGLRVRRRPLFGEETIRIGSTEFQFLAYLTIEDIPRAKDTKEIESLPETYTSQPLEDLLFLDPFAPGDEDDVTHTDENDATEEANLSDLNLKQLQAMAKGRGLKGYSRMRKQDLVVLLGGD